MGFTRVLMTAWLVWPAAQPAHAEHNLFVIHGPPPMHWTGFYWGGHVGVQWAEIAGQSLADPARTGEFEERSWSAGLGLGYDREISTVVFGWTADIDLTPVDIESRLRDIPIPGGDLVAQEIAIATELKWLSTFRGRIALRMERFLPFATAGFAVARAENSATVKMLSPSDPMASPTTLGADATDWVAGFAGGGGLEYRLTPRDVIGVEYLYVDLPLDDASPLLLGRKTAEDFTSHIVRALFRYRF